MHSKEKWDQDNIIIIFFFQVTLNIMWNDNNYKSQNVKKYSYVNDWLKWKKVIYVKINLSIKGETFELLV